MRKLSSRTCRLIMAAAVFFSPLMAQQLTPASATKTPVLVELFTSEGCSTCPPADRALAELKLKQPVENSQIIALGFHVDYWDHEGWRDRFSSHEFTERQKKYAERLHDDVYTPQLVVDGVTVVNDGRTIPSVISRAASEAKPLQIALDQSADSVQFRVSGNSQAGEAYLAVIEESLETSVRGGENNGHKLQHAAVVRDWHTLGRVEKPDWSVAVRLKIPGDANKQHLQLVGLVQDPETGKVLGLSSVPIR